MKYLYAVLSLSLAFPYFSQAQYAANSVNVSTVLASDEVPVIYPSWEKEEDQVNGHISKSKLSKMKNVTGTIISLLQDSCMFEGAYNPVWHGEYFPENTGSGPLARFGAACNFADQKVSLSITANEIKPLLGHLVVNNQDLLTITIPAASKKDCLYFEYAPANNSDGQEDNKNLRSKAWLITTGNGQLPYIAITRKEYLQEARTELTNIKNNIIADLKQKLTVRPAAVQEAEKKAAIDQLNATYSGIDLQVRMKQLLRNYHSDEEYLKASTNEGTAAIDHTLHLMDSLLSHLSAKELVQPAVVSVAAADFGGFEDGHADKMLIRINNAYFNYAVGAEAPQMFLVSWQFDPSEPFAADIDRQIQANFDTQKLKGLLTK